MIDSSRFFSQNQWFKHLSLVLGTKDINMHRGTKVQASNLHQRLYIAKQNLTQYNNNHHARSEARKLLYP